MTDTKFAKFLVALNGLVPAALLVWDAAHHDLGANAVNYSIRTTGMLALVFLTLSLCVTPVRKLTGWNQLISVRRMLGLYAFFYALAHFAIFFGLDRALSVSSTLAEMVKRKYLVVGTIGLTAMVPLAVTSTNAMVRRLGAKRWQALHRLAYVAAVAGVLHFYMLVKADVSLPIAFAVAVGFLLTYRVVTRRAPVTTAAGAARPKFWSGQLRVANVADETHDTRTFRLTTTGGGLLPFRHLPGQYLNLTLPIDGKRVHRSYTIASSPTRPEYVEITVKRDGVASRFLHDHVHPGDLLNVSAPAGRFTFVGDEARGIVLVGAGVGITPLMSVVRYLTDRAWDGEIYLLYSARTAKDLIFRTELADLQKRFPNLHVTFTLTREAATDGVLAGRLTADVLTRVVPQIGRRLIHLCGPNAMMEETRKTLVQLGVPDAQVRTEAFVSPTGGATDDAPAADEAAAGGLVTFTKSGKSTAASAAQTLLEAAESIGLELPYECRSGICGTCRARLISGRVVMDVKDALSNDDERAGFILPCQAHAAGDVVIEA